MIRLKQVVKQFAGSNALCGVNLNVEQGEFVVLLGTSGCGKTTTLKLINRLIEATSGTIEVGGRDVSTQDPVLLRRSIGYAFQGVGLFPHLSVAQNIGLVPGLLGWPRAEIESRVDELLALIGLDAADARERRPATLSGGQAQRVGVARALASRPKVMLLDEPFGAVDPLTRDSLQREYRQIHERLGVTTVMVTHDMTEALLLADKIAVMHAGSIVGFGTAAQLLRHPPHPQVERLFAAPRRHAQIILHHLEMERP
jgi:osmoprotectant transport system ATP-binding protein